MLYLYAELELEVVHSQSVMVLSNVFGSLACIEHKIIQDMLSSHHNDMEILCVQHFMK